MDNDNLNIEDLFKDSFASYKVEPQGNIWYAISKKMFIKKFTTFNLTTFNIYYLAAITLIIISCCIFLLTSENRTYQVIEVDSTNKSTIKIREIQTKIAQQNQNFALKKRTKKTLDSETPTINQQDKTDTVEVLLTFVNSVQLDKPDKSGKLEKIKHKQPQPMFEVDKKEGCVPFKIKIKNYTKYAQKYEWYFGNGEKSSEMNPVFTYQKPGVYTIVLKVQGLGGAAASFVDSIVVHDKLINKTEHSFKDKISKDEPFSVKLEGRKSVKYKWYFGDGYTSTNKNDTHSYNKEGVYPISLIATSEENCYDSVLITNARVVKSPNNIVFPTAFSPDLSGPSSGRYTQNVTHNNVFYPRVIGTLNEYHMKIYTKTGVVLFETKDVNVGWNGYYQNRLVPKGVYLYAVIAKFEGETRAIQKKGDVTVLYNQGF